MPVFAVTYTYDDRTGLRLQTRPEHRAFLTARFDDPTMVYRVLAAQGIVVRDVTRYPRLGDALRISVGTPRENTRLLEVLHAGAGPGMTAPPETVAGRP